MTRARTTFSIREICSIGIFSAVTAIFAQFSIPLPFSPVPLSFGLVAVYISGMLLRPKAAVISQLCYLLLGAIGVPVFHNFTGGPVILFGATGGYLMVYPIMALIISYILNLPTWGDGALLYIKAFLVLLLSLAICYIAGSIWLSMLTGNTLKQALVLAVYPFIPMDLAKIIITVPGMIPIRKQLANLKLLA